MSVSAPAPPATSVLTGWAASAGTVPTAVMARVFGALYVAGPAVALLVGVMPDGGSIRAAGVVAISVVAVIAGTLLLNGAADDAPRWFFGIVAALATVAVAAAVYFVGRHPVVDLAMFALWFSPYFWYFFDRAQAVAQTVFVAVAVYVALVAQADVDGPTDLVRAGVLGRWFVMATTLAVIGALTQRLLRQLQVSTDWLRHGFEESALGLVMAEPDGHVLWCNPAFAGLLGRVPGDIIGRPMASLAAPEERAELAGLLRDAGRGPAPAYRRRLLHRTGREVLTEVHRSAIEIDGRLYRFAQVRDITADVAAQRERGRLAALVEASDDLIATADLDGRLTYLNAAGRRLLGYDGPLPATLTTDRLLDADSGAPVPQTVLPRLLAGEVVHGRWSLAPDDGPPVPVEGSLLAIAESRGEPPTVLAAVLRDRRERERVARELDRVHEQRRQLLAEVVRAAESERHRIARDVHDDSVQVMAALDIRFQLLQRHLAGAPERVAEVQELRRMTATATERLRALIFDLEPTAAGTSLHDAVRGAAAEIFADTGVAVEVAGGESLRPPAELALTVYRVTREALANASKHAAPTRVRVTIDELGDALRVVVDDDGVGGPVDATGTPGHLGVVSMRERTELAGGTFAITASPLGGVRVAVEVPLPSASEREHGGASDSG